MADKYKKYINLLNYMQSHLKHITETKIEEPKLQ